MASAVAQASKSPVGIHELASELVHPTILPKLHEKGRQLKGVDLALHPSLPMRISLTRGKRPHEYLIDCEPKIQITRLIVPGLVNAKLSYEPSRSRPVRFELYEALDSLWICNHYGALGSVAGHDITFVDMDHDGHFGAVTDGYVVRPPKEKAWADNTGRVVFKSMTDPLQIGGKPHWLLVDSPGFTLVVTDREPDFTVQRDKSYALALASLNRLRAAIGHAPVLMRAELSRACEEHALYCATQQKLTFTQDPKLPGATSRGAKVANTTDQLMCKDMETAIHVWVDSFFHRINLLSPTATRVGMGLMQGVALIDARTEAAPREFAPWAWPAEGADAVPGGWQSGDGQSPIDIPFTPTVAASWGYPITVTFPSRAVNDVRAKLVADGKELPALVTSPERPGNPEFPDNANSILVMARDPMPPGTKITVTVQCSHAGKPFEKTWSFKTASR